MKNKLISIILLICILISSTATVQAKSDLSDKQAEKLSILSALDILQNEDTENFDKDSYMIKKAFYRGIGKIMKSEDISDSEIVSLMKEINVPFDEKNFDEYITKAEAVTAVMHVLGYKNIAAINNSTFNSAISKFGISKYVSGNYREKITSMAAAELLYVAASENIYVINSVTDEEVEYKQDATALEYYRNIYKREGIVTENRYSSLNSDVGTGSDKIKINNVEYNIGTTNASDFLGYYVTMYAYENDDVYDNEVVYIGMHRDYEEISVDAQDIEEVTDKTIKYELDGKIKTLKISPIVRVIYNGVFYGDYSKEDFTPDCGKLVFVENNGDKEYDVVHITSYELAVVRGISQVNKKIYNKYATHENVDVDNDKFEINIVKDGKKIEYTDLSENDVLLVAKSKSVDNTLINIIVSSSHFSGKVNYVNLHENEIGIDGKKFDLSKLFAKKYETEPRDPAAIDLNVGDSYEFYLDSAGQIAFALKDAAMETYIVATNIYLDDTDDRYKVKAMTLDNTWKVFPISEKAKLNDGSTSGDYEIYNVLGGSAGFTPQILKVKTNKQSELKKIETAIDSDTYLKSKFTKRNIPRSYYHSEIATLNGKCYMSDDMPVVVMPEGTSTSRDDYLVTGRGIFKQDSWYAVEAYDMDEFNNAGLVVYRTALEPDSDYMVVTDIDTAATDSDELLTTIKTINFQSGAEAEFSGKDEEILNGVEIGDIVRIGKNASGAVSAKRVFYSPKNSAMTNIDKTAINESNTILAGRVTKLSSDKKMINIDSGSPHTLRYYSGSRTVVYDGKTRKVSVYSAGFSDIEEGDFVYMYISYTRLHTVYIIRK